MPRIKVQVKRRTDKVAVDALRSFMAVLSDQDVGLFVSAGGFTRKAENEARTQEKRKITLLGLEQFFDLWLEHYAKVEEGDHQLLPLKPVYFLAPCK
jgi:restriction system protein